MSSDLMRTPKGLEGVIFGQTAISKVNTDKKTLTYRGYPVHELASVCSFEEVAYLLWNGNLPTERQLNCFREQERELRPISKRLSSVLAGFPKAAHPMDSLRAGVGHLAMEDARASHNSSKENVRKAMLLLAKIPTIVAYTYRFRNGLDPIAPNKYLSFAENFFYMCFGEIPNKKMTKALDGSLTLYAEHGFNASTFTSRVTVSTLSDIYAGVIAAIGALKGRLHGGANEQVMYMFKEIAVPNRAREWLLQALRKKRKIMGFGHRIYRKGDSRVPTMSKFRDEIASIVGDSTWVEIARVLEKTMLAEKNIYPNLDFPASPTYYMMGFKIEMFTPIFVMARITGWTAHIMEQLTDNRLVRPESEYIGMDERAVSSLPERGELYEKIVLAKGRPVTASR